ncbi:XrtA/PEP-CTERM system TPR-repeat protein PrsT [Rhodoferax sp. WC2427]|uniref:XrtA/PEP-CTERM system TPR-repeat protein PrsT n=1 Tax=Rhodoferax sp. WC2427 TaxID=3234144 RepID=UPI003465F1E2
MKKTIFLHKLLPVLIAAGLLSACGDEKPEVLIAAAKTSLEKNDQKTAIIQIKNALQADPNLPEARFLLGSALLASGDPAAAEIEFDKSRRLKYLDDLIVPKLAQSLLFQGKFKKITEDFSKTELQSTAAKANLQISLSKAYAAQGLSDLSQSALNSALSFEPENPDALIIKSRDLAAKGDFSAALSLIDAVIAKNPENPEAFKMKGDILLFGKKDLDAALSLYKKSTEVKSNYIPGYAGALTVLFQQEKLDDAQKELDALKKFADKNPQTKYFEVQLAYQKKDFLTARSLAQQLLKISPDNPVGLQSAGLIEFQLNSFLQAEIYLSKAVTINPALTIARRLLVMTYLRMGQPDKALATLRPGLAQEPIDTALYSIAGEVFLQNGDIKKAGEYFSKASKLDPKDGRKRTSVALVRMMEGETASAFNELDDIAASDQGISANLALISAHLRRQDFDKALKAIDGMEKKQPDNPFVFNLRGKIQISQNDYVNARKNFEKAVAINPTYFPAIASLAGLDVFEKKPEDAKKRLEALLVKEPKNNQALLALAELRARLGGTKEEIAESINKAIAANPSEVGPRILLVDFYLRNKDNKAAFSAAQNAATVLPDSMEVLDALGRSQLASGDTNQAILSYTKLVSLQPQSIPALMRLAGANMAAKNTAAAEQALNKVLELKPDSIEAQSNLIMLNMSAERYPKAVEIARSIQKQRPKEIAGYVLEGDVNVAQKKWDDALAAYRAGLKQSTALEPATKIHAVLNASDRKAEADKFATSWMKDHPKDVQFVTYLGDAALAKKDFFNAEKFYAIVAQAQPDNAVAFNNLAWISGQLKKDSAIAYAEKANKLAPNQPAFMDTLAMLLSEKGDSAKAIELQNKVIALQPENPVFKLNLAKIYIKSGDKKQAKVLLDDLTKLGDKFSAQAEVDAALKSL